MSRSLHKAEELAQAGATQFDSQIIEEEFRERYKWALNQPRLVPSSSAAIASTHDSQSAAVATYLDESQVFEPALITTHHTFVPPPAIPAVISHNPALAHLENRDSSSKREPSGGSAHQNKMSAGEGSTSISSGSTTQELSSSWYGRREEGGETQNSLPDDSRGIDILSGWEEDFSQNRANDTQARDEEETEIDTQARIEEEMETQLAPETPANQFPQLFRRSFAAPGTHDTLPPSDMFGTTQASPAPAIPTSASHRPSPDVYSPDNIVSPRNPAISSPIKQRYDDDAMDLDSANGSHSSDDSGVEDGIPQQSQAKKKRDQEHRRPSKQSVHVSAQASSPQKDSHKVVRRKYAAKAVADPEDEEETESEEEQEEEQEEEEGEMVVPGSTEFPTYHEHRRCSVAEDYIAQTLGTDARDTQQEDLEMVDSEVVLDSQVLPALISSGVAVHDYLPGLDKEAETEDEDASNLSPTGTPAPLTEISSNILSTPEDTKDVVFETSPIRISQGPPRTFAQLDGSNPQDNDTQLDLAGLGFTPEPEEIHQAVFGSLPAVKSPDNSVPPLPTAKTAHDHADSRAHQDVPASPLVLQSSSLHGPKEPSRTTGASTGPVVLDTPLQSSRPQNSSEDTPGERRAKRLKSTKSPNLDALSVQMSMVDDDTDQQQAALASADTGGQKYSTAPEAPLRRNSIQSSLLSELSNTNPTTPEAFKEPSIMTDDHDAEMEVEHAGGLAAEKSPREQGQLETGEPDAGEPDAEGRPNAEQVPQADEEAEIDLAAARIEQPAKKDLKRKRATNTPASTAISPAKGSSLCPGDDVPEPEDTPNPAKATKATKATKPSKPVKTYTAKVAKDPKQRTTAKKAPFKAITALKDTSAIRSSARQIASGSGSGSGSARKVTPQSRVASEPTSRTRSSSRLSTAPSDSGNNVPSTQGQTSRVAVKGKGNVASPSGIFSTMAFAVTYAKNVQEKEDVLSKILNEGGRVLNDGFDELFTVDALPVTPSKSRRAQKDSEKGLEKLKPNAVAESITFACVIADQHSRKAKYMQALSLDLPCLHGQWIIDCVTRQRVIDWTPYLLCSGESSLLRGAVRSRLLVPYPAESANFSEQVGSASRMKLLQGKNVLVVVGNSKTIVDKRKAYVFITQAMGAEVVGTVPDAAAARAILESESGRKKWDWIYVDRNEEEGQNALESPKRNGGGSTKAKKSTAKKRKVDDVADEDELAGPAPSSNTLRAKVVGDEFIIQSLILGRLLDDESPQLQDEDDDDEL